MTATTPFAELCPGCFTEKGNANPCPHCAYDESLKRGPLLLPHRSLLNQGQYLIGKVLGKPGGFGITYLAFDTKLETRVAIKEYLPRDLAGRDGNHATISAHSEEDGEFFRFGLTQFLQEARTLAKFDHANIVRVRNFFEENGTGYLVMDYYDGVTLADYLTQQPQGKLPESTAVGILMPILDGLREVHAKHFLHRDIKPQNIYLTTGNRAILLDFGAARQAMGERSRSLSVVLSEGYAPYEQYHRRGEQGPWTDIYACAAVLYHAVAGQAPPPATERVHEDELEFASLGVSASLAEALRLGLAVDHKLRPQRMEAFQGLLLGSGAAGLAEGVEPKPVQAERSAPVNPVVPNTIKPTPGKMSQRAKVGLGAVAAVAIIIGVGAMLTQEKKVTVPATVAPVVAAPATDAPAPLAVNAEIDPGYDGYNEVTIRPSDIPRDAPRFESYPAKLYAGNNVKPDLHSTPFARMYRTRIKEWSKERPNFAGHYILATWGCGTECTVLAIVDAMTGKVFSPAGVATNAATNVHHELLEGGDLWHASGAIKFRPDSNLLVLIGMPEEDTTRRGISYYVWNGTSLSLVRFVHKAWYKDDK